MVGREVEEGHRRKLWKRRRRWRRMMDRRRALEIHVERGKEDT